MKDNFSKQAIEYAKYRPNYPPALMAYLFNLYGFNSPKLCFEWKENELKKIGFPILLRVGKPK